MSLSNRRKNIIKSHKFDDHMFDAVRDMPVDRRCNGNISLVTTGQDIQSLKEVNYESRTPSHRSPRVREDDVVEKHEDCHKTVQHILWVITAHLPMAIRAATTCAAQSLPYAVIIGLKIDRQIRQPAAPDINTGRLPTLSTRKIAGKVASILEQLGGLYVTLSVIKLTLTIS
jgi:hypothetical protein